MDGFSYDGWRARMAMLAARVADGFLARHGYPPGEQRVDGPAAAAVLDEAAGRDFPAPLLDLHRACAEVSLPDVENGWFLHRLERVLAGLDGADPVRVAGRWEVDVVVFGSDGGGTLLALEAAAGRVLALPPGPVDGQVYDDSLEPATVVADSLPAFLTQLEERVRRSVES